MTPPDRSGGWFYLDAGSERGPLSRRDLVRRFLEENLAGSTPVWSPETGEWTEAREVPWIAASLMEEDDVAGGRPEPVRPPPFDEPGAPSDPPDATPSPSPATVSTEDDARDDSGSRPHVDEAKQPWALFAGAAGLGALVVLVVAVLTSSRGGGGRPDEETARALMELPAGASQLFTSHADALQDSLLALGGFGEPSASRTARRGYAWQREFAFRGLARLSDAELERFVAVWERVLASVPDRLCARLATWEASSASVVRALGTLDPDTLEGALRLIRRAAIAELRDTPARRSLTAAQRSAAVASVLAQLDSATADTLRSALQAPRNSSRGLACWTERTLYRVAATAPDSSRKLLARALVTRP